MMSIIDFCSICFPKKKSIKKGEKKHNGPKPRFSTSQIDLQASGHVQLGVLYMLNRRYFSELRPGWGDRGRPVLPSFVSWQADLPWLISRKVLNWMDCTSFRKKKVGPGDKQREWCSFDCDTRTKTITANANLSTKLYAMVWTIEWWFGQRDDGADCRCRRWQCEFRIWRRRKYRDPFRVAWSIGCHCPAHKLTTITNILRNFLATA